MRILYPENFKEFYPSFQQSNLIKTCFDEFEIYEQDPLKNEFLFLEEIYMEIWGNILNRERMTNEELWRTNGLEQKHLDKVYKYAIHNPFPVIKAALYRKLYNRTVNWQHQGYKLSTTVKQILIFLLESFDNLPEIEFFELVNLINSTELSIYDIYGCHGIKNNIELRFEQILRKGETKELTQLLSTFYGRNINLEILLPWYKPEIKIVKRAKDLYIILENDPYFEYQLKISEKLENDYRLVHTKEMIGYYPLEIIKELVSKETIERLIADDESNNYFKSIILRYMFLSKYYGLNLGKYIERYRNILNEEEIKIISKEDLMDILEYSLKITDNNNYYNSDYFLGFFRRLAKYVSQFKNMELLDDEIISSVKNIIFTYNSEKVSNHFFQAIGFVFFPDNLGNSANQFLENNKKYSSNLNELFIEIFNLGKENKFNTKKASPIISKVKEFPEELISSLFSQFINAVLETNLKEVNYKLLEDTNETFFRGLLYLLPVLKDKILFNNVDELCYKCFIKPPGSGAVSEKIGNSCINALNAVNDIYCLSLLARLKYGINHTKAKKNISEILQKEAKKRGLTPEEIEDMAINDFGLIDGKFIFKVLNYKAIIEVKDFKTVESSWVDINGKKLKSIPNEVKDSMPEKVGEIKDFLKEIEKSLSSQKERLDSFYLQNRVFGFQKWEKLFIENELLQFLGKKLIWKFSTGKKINIGFFNKTNFIDYKGNIINNLSEETQVSLWHPLDSSIEEVISWRDFINNNQIKQPFKQAYREIYLLTDAEIKTKTYSNRFAAHFLKQHQFSSLARLRGWEYQLLGNYDDGRYNEIAKKKINNLNITAEFWVNEINESEDFNDAGIWLYVSTAQVRFCSGNTKLELKKIPKIVFSEIMRDVDLFVGVASIGNDPIWQNRAENNYNEYWQSYSFGDLTETANTRKSALERLLPKLKISDKCSIDGKFLKVRGNFRNYKIHLGSSNILMEPNDQYLCIVPDRKTKTVNENVFLPFEDDKTFSLILSKAFLLANDTEIKDETILNQIKLKK